MKNTKSKVHSFWAEFVLACKGVSSLAFIASTGVASYVLFYSSDSTTLHGVALILAVRTGWDALVLSRSK